MTDDSASREEWVDAAKGIAICLVVLFHSSMFLELVDLAGPWPRVVALLDTFRMPLFFFTAGLFAHRALLRGFADLWRTRVAKLFWIYAVWTLFWILVFRPLLGEIAAAEVSSVNPMVDWLMSFVLPNDSTWLLWALGVYFLAAWLLRRVPVTVQLLLAAGLAVVVASGVLVISSSPLEKSATNFVFFLAAAHAGSLIRGRISRTSSGVLIAVAVVYLAAVVPAAKFELFALPGVKLVMGVLGIGFGVSVAVCLVRWRLGRGPAALGRRTMQVYLVHFYVAAAAAALAHRFESVVAPFSWALVPTVAVGAVAVSLAVHHVLRKVPGVWDLPRRRARVPA